MIPIGTRCIRISRYVPWEECVVVGYDDPRRPAQNAITGKMEYGCDHEIRFADGRQRFHPKHHLIPIGHDPDTETRTTDREGTA